MSAQELITVHLDLWTGAVTKKSSSGRGSNGKVELTGVKKLRELVLTLGFEGLLTNTEPHGWKSVTLGDIGQWGSGGTPTKSRREYYGGDIPWLIIKDLNDGIVTCAESSITEAGLKNSSAKLVPSNALLIAMYGSIGKLGITGISCATNQAIAFCIPDESQVTLRFLFLFLLRIRSHLLSLGQGLAQQNISQKLLKSVAINLPSLEDQHRIVQKVDELMALCDRLEQQTSDQLEAHETLVDTLLGTLTQSEAATELAKNWARLAAHFDTLFTTEQSIDKLKQTILQLAVMGRLVAHYPGDEPAENMLSQLAEVKQELITQGLMKKERKSQPGDNENAPYEIPESWRWCSLTDIGELARGKSKHRPRNDPSLYQNGTVPLIQTGDVARASPWITTFSAKYNQTGLEQSRLWRPGTLCITIAANIGDTGLLSFDACFPDSVVGFTPLWSDIPPEYFEYFLRTAKQHLEDFAPSTAQKNINLEVLQKLLVPLPPMSEMKRIVQKVDELMTLCDQLKERLNRASETRCQLAEAVVEGALKK